MADRHLPIVPASAPAPATGTPGVEVARPPRIDGDGGPEGGGASGGSRGPRPGVGGALVAAGLTGGLILALGVASLVGESFRRAVLVEVDRSPVASEPSYSDAPAEAVTFFARRDTVTVRIARDVTLADFLSLYHLETNVAARAALRDQLGVVEDGDVLREGDEVTLTITVPRIRP